MFMTIVTSIPYDILFIALPILASILLWVLKGNPKLKDIDDEASSIDETLKLSQQVLSSRYVNHSDSNLFHSSICVNHDIIIRISLFLDLPSIANLSLTSSTFHKLLQHDVLWKQQWQFKYAAFYDGTNQIMEGVLSERGIRIDLKRFKPDDVNWLNFYTVFDFCWVNYILAGLNTQHCCIIAVREVLYDISEFIAVHPGSEETLLWASGGDATSIFDDIGHSSVAKTLMREMLVYQPAHYSADAVKRLVPGSYWPNGALRSRLRRAMVRALSTVGSDYRNGVAEDTLYHQSHLLSLAPMTRRRRASGPCAVLHHGQCRVFLDPFTQEWTVWWTCCGWGMPLEVPTTSTRTIRRYSLDAMSSNLAATVNKTYHLLNDFHRTILEDED